MSENPGTISTRTPLDAAQKIVAELQGMAPDHQALALKFSIETLGLRQRQSVTRLSPRVRSPNQDRVAESCLTYYSGILHSLDSLDQARLDHALGIAAAQGYR